jgi:hypothetical protein
MHMQVVATVNTDIPRTAGTAEQQHLVGNKTYAV